MANSALAILMDALEKHVGKDQKAHIIVGDNQVSFDLDGFLRSQRDQAAEIEMLRTLIDLPEGVAPSDAPRAITRAEEWCRLYLDEKAYTERLASAASAALDQIAAGPEGKRAYDTLKSALLRDWVKERAGLGVAL